MGGSSTKFRYSIEYPNQDGTTSWGDVNGIFHSGMRNGSRALSITRFPTNRKFMIHVTGLNLKTRKPQKILGAHCKFSDGYHKVGKLFLAEPLAVNASECFIIRIEMPEWCVLTHSVTVTILGGPLFEPTIEICPRDPTIYVRIHEWIEPARHEDVEPVRYVNVEPARHEDVEPARHMDVVENSATTERDAGRRERIQLPPNQTEDYTWPCSICMDRHATKIALYPCGCSKACRQCLEQYFKGNRLCPWCRIPCERGIVVRTDEQPPIL